MTLLVVGGIAYDSISFGELETEHALGGSALYAALGAAPLRDVVVASIVGDDFDMGTLAFLGGRPGIRLEIGQFEGSTTRFHCRYDDQRRHRTVVSFEPGVAKAMAPLALGDTEGTALFLASGPPQSQLKVLESARPELVAMDTIGSWIEEDHERVAAVVAASDIVLMSVEELLAFTGSRDPCSGAEALLAAGRQLVCVKFGEGGSRLYGNDLKLSLPAFETATVDPTGAGDVYAGALLSYIDAHGRDLRDAEILGQAMVLATVMASFCVEAVGVEGLRELSAEAVVSRVEAFMRRLSFQRPTLP